MNVYQLGKDIGEILARLKALEENAARCHCGPCRCGCSCRDARGRERPGNGQPGPAPGPITGHGNGTQADPIQCLPYTPQANDQFCVYRVIDFQVSPDGSPEMHAQETVCLLCTENDAACETNAFWIVTLRGKYELTPKDPPGSDFCRDCPAGGHTFRKFQG